MPRRARVDLPLGSFASHLSVAPLQALAASASSMARSSRDWPVPLSSASVQATTQQAPP